MIDLKNANAGMFQDHFIKGRADIIKNDLLNTGVIQSVALTDNSTLYGGDTDDRFKWQGSSPENKIAFAYRNVSPEFITTSGMKMIAAGTVITSRSIEIINSHLANDPILGYVFVQK